jgi:hypothetical protein
MIKFRSEISLGRNSYLVRLHFGTIFGQNWALFSQNVWSHCICCTQAGNGGDGNLSLASVYRKEFAGPDGGNGGNGGHVIFRATAGVSSLDHIKYSPGSL